MWILIKKQFNRFRLLSPGDQLIQVSWGLLTIAVIYAVGLKVCEPISWGEAFWQSWQTITTVGYGNQPPEGLWGRIATAVFGTLGIGALGVFFSVTLDYKMFLRHRWRKGMMKNRNSQSYVIFNDPGEFKLQRFIHEVRTTEPQANFCLVDHQLDEIPESIQDAGDISFIKGSVLAKDTFTRANLKEAKAVIIFPIESNESESDASTKTTVDLVEQFIRDDTRVMHVLVNPDNAWLFENSRSVQILESFEVLTLVQECQDPYSAETVEDLLLNSSGTSPKTCLILQLHNWTWGELNEALHRYNQNTSINCNLLALIQDGKSNTCPQYDTLISSGDHLSVIAGADFNWKNVEVQIQGLRDSE